MVLKSNKNKVLIVVEVNVRMKLICDVENFIENDVFQFLIYIVNEDVVVIVVNSVILNEFVVEIVNIIKKRFISVNCLFFIVYKIVYYYGEILDLEIFVNVKL